MNKTGNYSFNKHNNGGFETQRNTMFSEKVLSSLEGSFESAASNPNDIVHSHVGPQRQKFMKTNVGKRSRQFTEKNARALPEYLSLNSDLVRKSKQNNQNVRIGVLSKTNGWLTVDSKSLSRRNAFENTMQSLQNRETSPLSPQWMQRVNALQKQEEDNGNLIRKAVNMKNTRIENQRVILYDSR